MRYLTNIVVVIFGFSLIGNLRILFFGGIGLEFYFTGEIGFHPLEYLKSTLLVFKDFLNANELAFSVEGKYYLLREFLTARLSYSMTLLFVSLIIALVITYCFIVIYTCLSSKIKKIISSLIDLLESLPDVFFIISLQLLVVIVYRQTGTLMAEIAVYDHNIYKLPIICLTIVPTVLLLKTTLLLLKEEEPKSYIELAKAKGLSSIQILLKHSLRNVLYSLFYHSKLIFAFMLSNLLIVEQLFNVSGLTDLLLWSTGLAFVITGASIFLPFYLCFTLGEFFVMKHIGGKNEKAARV